MELYGPEISDVVVDYDPVTLVRREVTKREAIDRLRAANMPARARRIAGRLATHGEVLDPDAVDGVLLRSHLELQRLHEEFRVGVLMRQLLMPVIELVGHSHDGPIRVVDLGCGLGFITRWLARHGELDARIELIGADYNHTLVTAAQRLADEEQLKCRFVVANAFALTEPAHVVISTGVLHHFRGDALAAVFREHARAGVAAFVHLDIRPSFIAPIGSWIFHRSRMREPLAQFDGYWSTVRAHHAHTLVAAAREATEYTLGTIDTRAGLLALIRIFQAVVGVRGIGATDVAAAFSPLGARYQTC
jgi:2-polyprenyl-3-methyl-5-hydroxy-6-metoxy-1,4-benzoquinol methylase